MDIYTRFNRKSIQDRQVDTLIGLSKGILADGTVNQAEAEYLLNWLQQNRQASDNPVVLNLLEKVSNMLEDGILDKDESLELLGVLQNVSGESPVFGEIAKTTSLPLNNPIPEIVFQGKSFLFTGTCAFGNRRECQAVVERLGGQNVSGVSKSLDYLVLGTYVTDSWIHESFGRKIEKAVGYRENGVPIVIMSEEQWIEASDL
jgi:NAD-dependent DNA ligase